MRLDVHPMVLAVALGLLSPAVLEADEQEAEPRLLTVAPPPDAADNAQCAEGADSCVTDEA
jgi:hypothetical protein